MVKVGQKNQAQPVAPAVKAEAAAPAGKAAGKGPELRPLSLDEIRALGGGEQKQPEKITVRFAPSPTGHLHIGGAWVALRNAMLAKRLGGDIVLRIEDTDRARSRPEYTEAIKDGLSWLGVEFEGEPIFQSQRTELYQNKVTELVNANKAYKDATGAVFFKMPAEGAIVINDRVKGPQKRDAGEESMNDFPILRADGTATFLLANVVDDGEQGITHVLRGDDHMDNAFKQVCLFRAMGYEVPEFYHMPLIHADAGGKLSKRHGATSLFEYRDLGYSPEVVMNHLARIGCTFDTDETLSFEDLSKRFDPMNISKSPGKIGLGLLDARMMSSIEKMSIADLSAELKARVSDDRGLDKLVNDPGTETKPGFAERTGVLPDEAKAALSSMKKPELDALAHGSRQRVATFAEALEVAASFRGPVYHAPEEAKLYAGAKQKEVLGQIADALGKLPAGDWSTAKLEKALDAFTEKSGVDYPAFGNALRWALTGRPSGFPLHVTLGLLGSERSIERLQKVVGG